MQVSRQIGKSLIDIAEVFHDMPLSKMSSHEDAGLTALWNMFCCEPSEIDLSGEPHVLGRMMMQSMSMMKILPTILKKR